MLHILKGFVVVICTSRFVWQQNGDYLWLTTACNLLMVKFLKNGSSEASKGYMLEYMPNLNTQSCIQGLLVVWDFCFWAVWAAMPVLKKKSIMNYELLLRPFFSCFNGQKMCFFHIFLHFSVRTKKLHNISFMIFKNVLPQNRLILKFSNLNVLLIQDWLFRLGVYEIPSQELIRFH